MPPLVSPLGPDLDQDNPENDFRGLIPPGEVAGLYTASSPNYQADQEMGYPSPAHVTVHGDFRSAASSGKLGRILEARIEQRLADGGLFVADINRYSTFEPGGSPRLVGDRSRYYVIDHGPLGIPIESPAGGPRLSVLQAIFRDSLKAASRTINSLTGLNVNQKNLLKFLYPRGFYEDMEQAETTGDCYFVAAQFALNRNPAAPYIFAATLKPMGQNIGVKFLGAGRDEAPIAIDLRTDLKPQEVVHGDGRRSTKHPLKGQLGDRILERAAHRRRKNNMIAGRGQAERHLTRMRHTMIAGERGHMSEPLELLLGDLAKIITEPIAYYDPEDRTHETTLEPYERLLVEFAANPAGGILTANTPGAHATLYFRDGKGREFGDGRLYFMDPDHFFYQEHAYAIIAVNAERRAVTVVNPHDTKALRTTISFEEFGKYFAQATLARLDQKRIRKIFGNIY